MQARIGGLSGRRRRLRRSAGVGGPPSILMWSTGRSPFVDDLAGIHWGPRRALRMQSFLFAARRAAGLAVATHSCA
eukprot:11159485-Lingulodinium_polyedra.AAC.1